MRVKAVAFAQQQSLVRDGKGSKSHVTMRPISVTEALRDQLVRVKRQQQQDLGRGLGAIAMPYALERQSPQSKRDWVWQFGFPSSQSAKAPRGDWIGRHHLHESSVQKAVKQAVRSTKRPKRVDCHTVRHRSATPLLEGGYDSRTLQE